jgi:AcrR family transcriptional regulator
MSSEQSDPGSNMLAAGSDGKGDSPLTTKERILDAAVTILGRDGLQALTTRAIAREASVNQALINYHFQTKDNLLLELSHSLESGKYARQWTMYHEPGVPLSQKWRQAVEFYRRDLADGFIRVNGELQHIAVTDSAIAESISARQERWVSLLGEVAEAYLPPLDIHVSPAFIASAITSFWLGMNARLLVNDGDNGAQIFEVLDFIGDWLEEREREYAVTSRAQED